MQRSRSWVWASLLWLTAPLAHATPPAPESAIEPRVRDAELVFRGTVQSVQYRMSEPDPGQPQALPHTFVTFEVEEVMKGAVEGGTITLRFLGGSAGGDAFMLAAEQPLFDVGDRDILLVRDPLESECPLVGCAAGRFRFIDGLVVDEQGRRIQVRDDASLAVGPAMVLEDVDTHYMGDSMKFELVEAYEDGEVPPTPEELERLNILDPEVDLDPERFADFVARAVRRAHTDAELEQAARDATPSADIHRSFTAWSAPESDDAWLMGTLPASPNPTRPPRASTTSPTDAETPAERRQTTAAAPGSPASSPPRSTGTRWLAWVAAPMLLVLGLRWARRRHRV